MTPRQIERGFKATPEKGISKKDVLDKYLKKIAKFMNNVNANLEDFDIPLHLKLHTYENTEDFKHLTEEDYIRVTKAPIIINRKTVEWFSKLNY
jgi:hypothetical protein